MGAGGGIPFQALKWALFIFNALFAILGLAVLITAAVVLSDTNSALSDYGHLARDEIKEPAGLLIFIGLVMFVVAGVGCLAAIRESRVLVLAFSSIIGFLVILEFGGSIAAYVYRNDVREYAGTKMMNKQLKEYWTEFDKNITNAAVITHWDDMQKGLKCCGVENYCIPLSLTSCTGWPIADLNDCIEVQTSRAIKVVCSSPITFAE
ncbi:unnamed protein product [Notodromas monacha]|uniref:Tetraspanin n=1 Tax=Notodromas monacha TaxID=399045 RepID=A0A7R9C1X0_9CRUS|nr:unnamed protein product [Notodromas monacha]CAG0924580.1 unnamed protein product [Notodromas monacha]